MNYSRDIRLKADGAVYYFKFLKWDSDFFSRPSFILDTSRSVLKPSPGIKKEICENLKGCFLTLKIDGTNNRNLFEFLQAAGFRYIDTELTLRYDNSTNRNTRNFISNDVQIKELTRNTGLPYRKLGCAFSLTRFHYDVNIPLKKADLVWINFIKNYKITPLNHMFVAFYKNKPIGAVLADESPDRKNLTLCFVSVIEEYRGKDIGSLLLKYITENIRGREIFTETQARNIKAVNFYIKNGFSVLTNTKIIMQRW